MPLIFTVGSANICNFGACVSLSQSCLVQQTFQGTEQALPSCLNALYILLSSGVAWTKSAVVQKNFVSLDNSLETLEWPTYFLICYSKTADWPFFLLQSQTIAEKASVILKVDYWLCVLIVLSAQIRFKHKLINLLQHLYHLSAFTLWYSNFWSYGCVLLDLTGLSLSLLRRL